MIMHDAKIYLCKPDRTPICELNGKQVNDIRYERNLKDFNKLTLSVDRYIDIDGQLIESNGYNRLKIIWFYILKILIIFNYKNQQ